MALTSAVTFSMTDCVETWPSPTAAYSAETSSYLSDWATSVNESWLIRRCSGRFWRRIARAIASLPCSIASSRRSLVNQPRILLRARVLLTKPSQSWLGPASGFFEVNTSTTSPLLSSDSSGTRRPLTFAPIVRCPTSVCTA